MAEKLGTLTDRDRYWLRQQEAWEKSGLNAKEYARKHGKCSSLPVGLVTVPGWWSARYVASRRYAAGSMATILADSIRP